MTTLSASYPYCRALDVREALTCLADEQGTLTPAEIADLCGFLKDEGVRSLDVCKILDCRDYVHSHYVRIARRLIPRAKDCLHKGLLSLGHARALARLPASRQSELVDRVVRGQLSVRDIEAIARGDDRRLTAADEAYYRRLSDYLSERCGHPITLLPDRDNARAGQITLRYETLDMLDAICALMRIDLQEFPG